jgi:DNA-binding transcriptional ArsR family regulator
MLEQIRHMLQAALDELLAQAEKVRRALAALGPGPSSPSPPAPPARRATAARDRQPQRARQRPATPSKPVESSASEPVGLSPTQPQRASLGETKSRVLAALADGEAMTAAQIATATGIGRGTVSTTLSRLAKAGEITKAARGYQLDHRQPASPAEDTPAEPSNAGESTAEPSVVSETAAEHSNAGELTGEQGAG